ncbi:HEAT repeat domain-containing protein [Hymenobacter sp. 102]|uniref:HEAT repeat domain-containing protein n=1 Tax=Hymenobacter sp. 102 TaxID=3403152 RepID=UPI003CF28824
MSEVEQLKQEATSDDWQKANAACNQLANLPGNQGFDALLSLLSDTNPRARNAAALALRGRADNRAIEPLLAAIRTPNTRGYNGTLVYALQTLDCRHHLKELFEILFYQGYEAKQMAMQVLEEQEFEFTTEDLLSIQRQWNACKAQPELCYRFEENHENIDYFVEGFMAYLTE